MKQINASYHFIDVNLSEVIRRLDAIGILPLKLYFDARMPAHKVLQVLLYRELQFLEKHRLACVRLFPKSQNKLHKRVDNICYLLSLFQHFFDHTILTHCAHNFSLLYEEEKHILISFLKAPAYERLFLDLRALCTEESSFFMSQENAMPLLVFMEQFICHETFRMAKKFRILP